MRLCMRCVCACVCMCPGTGTDVLVWHRAQGRTPPSDAAQCEFTPHRWAHPQVAGHAEGAGEGTGMVIVSRPQRHVWVEGGDGAGQHSKGLFFVHTVMMARPCPPRQGVVTLRYMPRASSTCVPWYAHREFPRWGGQAGAGARPCP